ncbi:MAG: hypothetical protein HQL57_06210, partial [Magnetococcales bacterium]|nr:hypothetical protein [Magnetococcales bacterium]
MSDEAARPVGEMDDARSVAAALRGECLYGDDFDLEGIRTWYADEAEAYAAMGAGNRDRYTYGYHALNFYHGFRFLPPGIFAHALGFGSAWGEEFKPLAGRVSRLTIVESSAAYGGDRVHGIPTRYVKPEVEGTLPFAKAEFDLIS